MEIVGIAAGVCTSLSLLPQLIKIFRTRKAEDISIFYLMLLLTGLVLWIWYGVMRDDPPIIYTNGFSLLLNILTLILGIKFKKNGKKVAS